MKLTATLLALAAAGTLAACDKPNQSTAYNNAGTSAAPATTASTPAATSPTTTAGNSTMAPGPAGDATGAMSETLTTGKIKAAIAADAGLKDTDISVTTNNGAVVLGGTVKSQDQVALAKDIAQRQDGVQKVETNLTVK